MARINHDTVTYAEAKRLLVFEGKTPREVSEELGGSPSASTVWRWAKHVDADGKSWLDLQREHRDEQYRANSPARIAADVQDLIEQLRADRGLDPVKKADALAKLTASLTKLTRPEHQLPAMYHMLEELVKHVRRHYPALFSKELLEMVRDFKNVLRQRVEGRL